MITVLEMYIATRLAIFSFRILIIEIYKPLNSPVGRFHLLFEKEKPTSLEEN